MKQFWIRGGGDDQQGDCGRSPCGHWCHPERAARVPGVVSDGVPAPHPRKRYRVRNFWKSEAGRACWGSVSQSGLSSKDPAPEPSRCCQAGLALQGVSRLWWEKSQPLGESTVLGRPKQGRGGRRGRGAEHFLGSVPGPAFVSPRPAPSPRLCGPAPGAEDGAGQRSPPPQAGGGEAARREASGRPSAGGDVPHQQGQQQQQQGRRQRRRGQPPGGLVDLAMTVAGFGLESRSGGPGGARASAGGRAVQPLGAHGSGGVRLGLDAALGEAPVVGALEEVGVTCEAGKRCWAGARCPSPPTRGLLGTPACRRPRPGVTASPHPGPVVCKPGARGWLSYRRC